MSTGRLLIFAAAALLSGCGSHTRVRDPSPMQLEVLQACKQSSIDVQASIEADELFIESHYLNYLAGTENERGHVQHPTLRRVVRYALEKGLTALETDLRFDHLESDRRGQITRITVKPAHSSECKAFRYPWWEMPELRKLGLSPDHCVAVERIDVPTAPTRLLARPTKVARRVFADREVSALWRVEVVAGSLDQRGQVEPSIRVIDHVAWSHGSGKTYGGWSWGCSDGGVRAKTLNAAISGKGNPLLRRPEVVIVPLPEPAVQETSIASEEIASLHWLERGRCAAGSNTFDVAGTVWVQNVEVGGRTRIALHVLRDNRLLIAPMPMEFDWRKYGNHSVLHSKDGFVVNLTRFFKNDESRRLVAFDENLRHIATWKLTPGQMESLTPPEPAAINWCRGGDHDQFQRTNLAPVGVQRH